MVAAHGNEGDALALVLRGIERNGPDDTDTVVLELENEDGELVTTTRGMELAEMARRRLGSGRLTV